jgi:glycosyltransferase involved in cell wall biosynthesis
MPLKMSHPQVSICIPAYEMHGRGAEFLGQLFESLRLQTFQGFEVILADHSRDSVIQETCQKWTTVFPIRYLHNSLLRGNASANLNQAIKAATGHIIKPMHEDDFLFTPTALQQIVDSVANTQDFVWGASGFVHTDEMRSHFYGCHAPCFPPDTPVVVNTIGAPSVLFFRNHKGILLDERLIWMNDAELAYRLNAIFGPPVILDATLVAVRQWPQQVTHTLACTRLRIGEIRYSLTKHHCWSHTIAFLSRRLLGKLTTGISKASAAP